MRVVNYSCDFVHNDEKCKQPAHREMSTIAASGNTRVGVRVRHVCSDPHHIGIMVDEAMYSDKEVAEEASALYPKEVWKSTRKVSVTEIGDNDD